MKLQTKALKMLRDYDGSRLEAERDLYAWLQSDPKRWRTWCERTAQVRVHQIVTTLIDRTANAGAPRRTKTAAPETVRHHIDHMKEILNETHRA